MDIPILFTNFNRPQITAQTWEALRAIKPKHLYVAVDGPREGREGEAEKVQAVIDIVTKPDWDCELHTLIRDQNLGCKKAMSSAITWFFENVEAGIILEDDCVPHPSFFSYVGEMLERYKDDERVMLISGDNFQEGRKRGDGSYYFSRYPHIWGWASWRRVWKNYDVTMSTYPEFKKQGMFQKLFIKPEAQEYWQLNFDAVYEGKLDTWDYQLVYHILTNNGMCVNPNTNMISNIGFHADATHTKTEGMREANLPSKDIGKIVHPTFEAVDQEADDYTEFNVFYIRPAGHVAPHKPLYREVAAKVIPFKVRRALLNTYRRLK